MMQIGPAAAMRVTEAVRPCGIPGASFRLPNPADTAQGVAASSTAATRGLDALLALQETGVAADNPAVRDREARRHGRAILEALAELQKALLGGSDDSEVLGRLGALLGSLPPAADAGLAVLLNSVSLRARIELARRGLPDSSRGSGG